MGLSEKEIRDRLVDLEATTTVLEEKFVEEMGNLKKGLGTHKALLEDLKFKLVSTGKHINEVNAETTNNLGHRIDVHFNRFEIKTRSLHNRLAKVEATDALARSFERHKEAVSPPELKVGDEVVVDGRIWAVQTLGSMFGGERFLALREVQREEGGLYHEEDEHRRL